MSGKYVIMYILSSLLAFAQKPLVLYCGATMVPAMQKIATQYAQETGQPITIIQGASGSILSALKADQEADLYLPGHPRFLRDDIFDKQYRLGAMRLVLFSRKGIAHTPKILDDLTNPNIRLALGCTGLGSIGNRTRDVLTQHKGETFYEQVMMQSLYCAVDSRDLVELYLHDLIDVGIMWKPALRRMAIDTIPNIRVLTYDENRPTPLILATVRRSHRHEAAEAFAAYVTSAAGKAVLSQEGFDVP